MLAKFGGFTYRVRAKMTVQWKLNPADGWTTDTVENTDLTATFP